MLYKVIAEHLETFLASLDDDHDATGLPDYVQREFYDYLQCGIMAPKEVLLACSCKRRGFCPSCAGRRMAQTAAHLVECHALGADSPRGRLRTDSVTLLDVLIT